MVLCAGGMCSSLLLLRTLQKWQFSSLVSLYLSSKIFPNCCMHAVIFSPIQFLCILLLKERYVQVQTLQHCSKGSQVLDLSYSRPHPRDCFLFKFCNFYYFWFFKNLFYVWLHWIFVAAHGLSLVWLAGATLCCSTQASHFCGFSFCRPQALEHRLRCSTACGIFPGQGPNLCPLHWQVDSYPLDHQGSPTPLFLRGKGLEVSYAETYSCWTRAADPSLP